MDKQIKGLLIFFLILHFNSWCQHNIQLDTVKVRFNIQIPPSFLIIEDVGIELLPRLKEKKIICNREFNYHLFSDKAYVKDEYLFKKLNPSINFLQVEEFKNLIRKNGIRTRAKCNEIESYNIELRVVVAKSNLLIPNYSLLLNKECEISIETKKTDNNYFIVKVLTE